MRNFWNWFQLSLCFAVSVSTFALDAAAAEESCPTCGGAVTVMGDFAHDKIDRLPATIDAVPDAALLHEDVSGPQFEVTIGNLPAGHYVVEIVAAEVRPVKPGEHRFSIRASDTTVARDLDLAKSPGRLARIRTEVDKSDDALRGPLRLLFTASQGRAKFNAITVRNGQGADVLSFSASDLADAFSAQATRVPDVSEPMTWRDSARTIPERAHDLIRRLSLAEKVAQLKNAAPAVQRLGLPAYDYWNEALHGVANNGVATVFPEPIGGAASWNPELFRQQGNVIGIEGRAKYNDYANRHEGNSKWWAGLTYWTPNINIFRDPRWGRGQETYGEDPFLTAEIGIAFVKGIQGDDPRYMLAMACAKHFAVHSGPEPDRHRFNATVTDVDLYETYLPQFERVVREAKVGGVMSAYNAIAGVPVSASHFMLTDLLREKWGFDGYVVSDCDAIHDIYGEKQHRYVKTAEEAAAMAIKAGCNLCCGGDYNALVRAVQQGLVTEAEIDNALYHTLWTRFRLGLFDPPEQVPFARYTLRDNDVPNHAQVALELARQSIVLLKNNGVLPLDRNALKQIAVIGPNAASRSMLEGNYHGSASHSISILDGIRHLVEPGIKVVHSMGSPVTTRPGSAPWSGQDNGTTRPITELFDEAIALAKQSDVVIYVGGITAAQEGESFDRENIELPSEQEALLKGLHATGKPVVMVNCSGSAMALRWEDENLPAVLQAWYPGQEGGRAVAEVLFGIVNPSGHLPVTFYRATSDLPSFTDYSMKNRTYRFFEGKALYPFGHGLSYTTFHYEHAHAASSHDGVGVMVDVQNTGSRDGDTVVQIYGKPARADANAGRPALCGFKRVHVRAGETAKVSVTIPSVALRRWDAEQKDYVIPRGDWSFAVGESSTDIRVTLQTKL